MRDEAAEQRDLEARRLAREEFSRPLVLEAGAGTGKTAALVSRILCWSLGPGWERSRRALGGEQGLEPTAERVLGRVCAITFTERAAVEMAERVEEALAGLSQGRFPAWLPRADIPISDDGELRLRAGALHGALDRLRVGTIHAFCRALLSDHAVEAGLHPAFEVDAEGAHARAICSAVVSERLGDALGESADESWVRLAAGRIGASKLRKALEILVQRGVEAPELEQDPFADTRVRRCAEELIEVSEQVAQLLRTADLAPKGSLKAAFALAHALEALARALHADRSLEGLIRAACEEALENALPRSADYAKGKFIKAESAAFAGCLDQLTALCARLNRQIEALRAIDPQRILDALQVLAPLLRETRRRLQAKGWVGFQELLERTRDLLARQPRICEEVRSSLDQLLVDEFQDTDSVQCAIVGSLALEGLPERRPGLFLVGDPKQSIYGWRSADLAAYESFVARALEQEGRRASLQKNFRSSQEVLDEVERLVAPLMLPEPGIQPPFERLIEGRASDKVHAALRELGSPVEHWVSWGFGEAGTAPAGRDRGSTRSDAAREIEARAIARDLAQLSERGIARRDCAILLRQATEQEVYLSALRESAVPFVVGKDRGFYRSREVIEACNLLAVVLDPTDVLAFLGVLRSPVAGVPDAALEPLWRRGLPDLARRLGPDPAILAQCESTIDQVTSDLRGLAESSLAGLDRIPLWHVAAKACLRALADLRRSFAEDSTDRFLERLRALLLVEEGEAARFLGAHRLANLERFFERALDALRQSRGGPHGLLRELRSGAAGELELESATPADEHLDAVRVLTIHAAKGLEFAQVYLPDLNHQPRSENDSERFDVERTPEGLELCVWGAPTLGWSAVRERRHAVRRAETVRLLYVATTRARERLVLAGRWPGGKDTLLQLVEQRMGGAPDLDAWAERAIESDGPERRVDGVRWFLPGAIPPAQLAPVQPASMPELEPGRVRAQARTLEASRQAAAARSARPRVSPASLDAHARLEELHAGDGHGLGRDAALAIGVAAHRALELLDPRAEPAAELERLLPGASAAMAAIVPAERLEPARAALRRLLEAFVESPLFERLRELEPHVLARELPLLIESSGEEGPVSAHAGAIDLLYRDPRSGELVVVDYKTDSTSTPEERHERACAYQPQLAIYVDAVHTFFGEPVRAELWFVGAGEVVPCDGSSALSARATSARSRRGR